MWHRTGLRLLSALGIALLLGIAALLSFCTGEQRRLRRLFEQKVIAESSHFFSLLELKGSSLAVFAFDYAYWDDMVDFYSTRDRQWGDENIAEALGTYQADAAWLFDTAGELVYAASSEEKPELAGFVVPDSCFVTTLRKEKFAHFFLESPAGLLEVRGATVHPSNDPDRLTPARGIFLVARVWDSAYLAGIEMVTHHRISLDRAVAAPLTTGDGRNGRINICQPLRNWRGEPIASIRAEIVSNEVREFRRAGAGALAMLVLVMVVASGLMGVAILFHVTKPLQILEQALSTAQPEALGPLLKDRSEFGELARLVRRKFELEKDLKRSNQELEHFAYVASHDLQEPLRMVSSFTQLLARRYQGRLDKDADEFIAFAVDGANRMQRLINDLLQYSRIGTHGRQPEPTDAEEVLNRALMDLKLALAENRVEVTHERLPVVLADSQQLEQLFRNLIGNAIKFHGDSPPRVHIRAERSDGAWMFSVKDNGIGIDPGQHERIFEIFQRAHTRKEYPGTGIGLAVCKKIVERHGGRIWVESEPGRGADFRFVLPAAETEG